MIKTFLLTIALIAFGIATVTASAQQPAVSSAANAASFASGAVAPGSLATLFGSNLATQEGIVGASTLPLPISLENVSVQMFSPPDYKTVNVPILAVADLGNGGGQINFQVPWESAAGATPNQGNQPYFVVAVSGVPSGSFSLPLASAQPGIFVCGAGLACVQHQSNYQLADADHPVSPGDVIIVYATGLGAVTTAQTDGQPATGADSTVVTPAVTIAGLPAKVMYSGLTPGDVGLYQLDVVVPANAPIGSQFVTITMQDVVSGSNVASNSPLIPIGTVVPTGTVAISPASVTLVQGSSQQFSATVTGAAGKVIWSASAGTIDANGMYIAPAAPPNPNFFLVVATAANGASASATVTVAYSTPVITSVTPPLIYLEHGAIIGGQSGAIQINGSGFAPGGVLWSCIGSLCGGDTLSQGTNPSMIGFNAAFEGSTYDPGWYDYYVTTPDGKSSNLKSFAFLGAENLLALTPTRAFVYDPSGHAGPPGASGPPGYVRRFNLSDGSSDGGFIIGSMPAGIDIDNQTNLVLFSTDDSVLGDISGYVQDPPPVNFGGGVVAWFSDMGTGDGNNATSVVAKSGIACVAEPDNGQVACASLTGLDSVNANPPMTSAKVGSNPWPMVMSGACATGELDGFTYSRDDQTLWKFVAAPGSTPGTVTTTVNGSLALSGFALPANLYLAGGWYFAALEPSSGGCTIALLAPKVDAQNNIMFSIVFFDGVRMQQIAIADNLPQSSFRLAADNAHGGMIVAYADTDARLTRFVKVDTTGAVTALASTTDILTVGLQVSPDGTSIYGAMRDQFQIIPNQ